MARADWGTDIAGGRVEAGVLTTIGAIRVAPFASVELDRLWQAAFAEQAQGGPAALGAAGLALRYGSNGQTSAGQGRMRAEQVELVQENSVGRRHLAVPRHGDIRNGDGTQAAGRTDGLSSMCSRST